MHRRDGHKALLCSWGARALPNVSPELRPTPYVAAGMRAICVLGAAVAVCAVWPAGALAGTVGDGNVSRIDCAAHGPCAAVDDRNDVTVAANPGARWAWSAQTTDVYGPAAACT